MGVEVDEDVLVESGGRSMASTMAMAVAMGRDGIGIGIGTGLGAGTREEALGRL